MLAAFDRGDVVGQAAEIRLPFALPLLPQHRHAARFVDARVVGVDDDVVAVAVGGEEAVDAAGDRRV